MNDLFQLDPLVITALHLPDPRAAAQPISTAWLEDYVLANLGVFARGGVPAVMLQDETLNAGRAHPETIAVMAALGRLARREYPNLHLGIIIQAHDPVAPLAVAHACGAEFVRIKVFVGAMLKAEGLLQGAGIEARDYRRSLGAEAVRILADVHDRTGLPLLEVPIEQASRWAVQRGADALVLTGRTYDESLEYLRTVRQSGVAAPLLMGGSATEQNVGEVLRYADGVIASTAFKRKNAPAGELVMWEEGLVARFMDAARAGARARRGG